MKLVYILSMGHSGSTVTDCILGTHPDFTPSGELRYLNWQIERTKNKEATVSAQNICTCENDFRNCEFWSEVFELLKEKSGKNIVQDPESFDTKYFGYFSHSDRDGHHRSLLQKIKGYLFREWLEKGWPIDGISWIEPKLNTWLNNNWLLYETMSDVSNKPIVVDSSKHLLIALLLQQYKPDDVWFLFIHRDIRGLVASEKKWAKKKSRDYSFDKIIKAKIKFESRVEKYKKIKDLNYIDADYEQIVKEPATFLDSIVNEVEADTNYLKQENNNFYIDPSKQHLVGGNPMRYKGRMKVEYDDRWKFALSDDELDYITKQYRGRK